MSVNKQKLYTTINSFDLFESSKEKLRLIVKKGEKIGEPLDIILKKLNRCYQEELFKKTTHKARRLESKRIEKDLEKENSSLNDTDIE